ncbi:3D domain-containing protein [Paenibacillus sp. JSM ZJ436]|uniref:3D domain-containing protein n=1 Tax=Paenibacillus sp. JSM ZJ436 TaxID=3376190 RepID=UPI0037972376
MLEVVLSLLLALSVGKTGIENANQAREAKNTTIRQDLNVTKLVESERVEKEIKKQAKPQAKEEGSNSKKEGYWDTYTLTAYTANYESTSKKPGHPAYGITASGEEVRENYTLACPKELKFGTKIYIPYFDNTYVCTDRGGAIRNKRLDVYMFDLQNAMNFGKRKLDVKIIYD